MSVAFRSGPAIVLAAVVMLTASCTRAAAISEQPAEPAVGEIPVVVNSAALRLPVELYLSTAVQNDRAARARLVLIRKCLARYGFSYTVNPVASSAYGPASLTDRRYGITDAELAGVHGYGLGPRDPGLVVRPEKPEIGTDGQTVLTGYGRTEIKGLAVPEGGCIAEADRALNRDIPKVDDVRLGNQLQFQSFEQSKADSRVRAVSAAWSACMKQTGLHYADPLGAAADPEFSGPPSPREIQVALADIRCKTVTNLVGVWFAVEAAYQQRAIDADSARFAAARAAIEAQDRAAAAVAG
jgi:hypothetical protein